MMRRRGQLRSSTSSLLNICSSRLVTVGDCSFAAAAPRLWIVYLLMSSLPHHSQHFARSWRHNNCKPVELCHPQIELKVRIGKLLSFALLITWIYYEFATHLKDYNIWQLYFYSLSIYDNRRQGIKILEKIRWNLFTECRQGGHTVCTTEQLHCNLLLLRATGCLTHLEIGLFIVQRRPRAV